MEFVQLVVSLNRQSMLQSYMPMKPLVAKKQDAAENAFGGRLRSHASPTVAILVLSRTAVTSQYLFQGTNSSARSSLGAWPFRMAAVCCGVNALNSMGALAAVM